MANQQNETLAAEKHRQLDYEIQMKEQQVQILQEQAKVKQTEFRETQLRLEDELETERENGIKVESLTAQKDKMQKLITGLQEGLE